MNRNELQLLAELSDPDAGVVKTLAAMEGDLILLGAGGKIGYGLALMAKRAFQESNKTNRVIAVSRFRSPGLREEMESDHIETITCDLSDAAAVRGLPDADAVIYMAGLKFGTSDNPGLTWLTNTYVPALVAQRYCDSTIVAYSSGNIYPLAPADGEGPTEDSPVGPVGEYGQTVLGRERILEYFSRSHGTPMTLVRLNYANEPRYGVLVDLAMKVRRGEPIDVSMGYVNVVWQTDANRVALKCFDLAASPPAVVNLAGPKVAVREMATRFGEAFGKEPIFVGQEADTALLSCGDACWRRLGPPEATLDYMIGRIADWLMAGYLTWRTPTHFEVREGAF